jgi:hypothetical protein
MNHCPSTERLQDLLTDCLVGPEAAALAAHVEACVRCQQTLEELTSNAAPPNGRGPTSGTEAEADFLRPSQRPGTDLRDRGRSGLPAPAGAGAPGWPVASPHQGRPGAATPEGARDVPGRPAGRRGL